MTSPTSCSTRSRIWKPRCAVVSAAGPARRRTDGTMSPPTTRSSAGGWPGASNVEPAAADDETKLSRDDERTEDDGRRCRTLRRECVHARAHLSGDGAAPQPGAEDQQRWTGILRLRQPETRSTRRGGGPPCATHSQYRDRPHRGT